MFDRWLLSVSVRQLETRSVPVPDCPFRCNLFSPPFHALAFAIRSVTRGLDVPVLCVSIASKNKDKDNTTYQKIFLDRGIYSSL